MAGQSSPELGDKCEGLQARGRHSSPELGDNCLKDCKREADTTAHRQMSRIASERWTQQTATQQSSAGKHTERRQKGDKASDCVCFGHALSRGRGSDVCADPAPELRPPIGYEEEDGCLRVYEGGTVGWASDTQTAEKPFQL